MMIGMFLRNNRRFYSMIKRCFTILLLFTLFSFCGRGAGKSEENQGLISKENLVLETNFVENVRMYTAKKKGSFSGPLPIPWIQDYTGFKNAVVCTEILNWPPDHFMRFSIQKGEPQFLVPLKGIQAGKKYRLSAFVRNQTKGCVRMSLRYRFAPYITVAEGLLFPSEDWKNREILFEVPAKTPSVPLVLMMIFEGGGTFDIVYLKLQEIGDAEKVPPLLKRPPKSCKNYFRNSCFPLGLQSGWVRYYSHAVITADPAVKGPSGAPALKLSSPKGQIHGLCSEPFNVADVERMNSVSFSFKGNGRYSAGVYSENKCLASLQLNPGADWKRVAIPFKAPADALSFTIRFQGDGTVFLDAFRAAPADQTEYVPTGECEIALALPKSEISSRQIQFEDEASLVKYHLTGKADGVTLRFKIVNLYQKEKVLPEVRVTDQTRDGVLNYLVFPEVPYGQFRIEVQAFRNGKPVSRVNELVVTRIKRPLYWGRDAKDSPFGVHVMAYGDILKAVKAAGINWVRLHDAGYESTSWFYLEPEKGKWRFRDSTVRAYRNHHLKIFGQLGTAPKWASFLARTDTGRKKPGYFDRYFQPSDREAFANYVRVIVGRYKGVIDDWFIWNEPWGACWWAIGYDRRKNRYITSKNPAADFAGLCKTAYLEAKKVNPNVKIAGFNTTGGMEGERWTEGVYNAGGLEFCDAVDFHYYTARRNGYPGDGVESMFRSAFAPLLKKDGKIGKEIYMSEGQGASTGGVSGDRSMRYAGLYRHTVPWNNWEDYHSIAEYNIRYLISLLSLGVKRVFFYAAHSYSDFSAAPNFLFLFCADGSPHPMFVAHAAFAERVENMSFVKVREIKKGIFAYFFSDHRKSLAAVSSRFLEKECSINCDLKECKVADLYGNPVELPAVYRGVMLYFEAPVPVERLEAALVAGAR